MSMILFAFAESILYEGFDLGHMKVWWEWNLFTDVYQFLLIYLFPDSVYNKGMY